jgi:hypothetical protein
MEIDLGILNQLIALRLRNASGIANRLFGEAFAPRRYVPKQYSVAYLIASRYSTTQAVLSKR